MLTLQPRMLGFEYRTVAKRSQHVTIHPYDELAKQSTIHIALMPTIKTRRCYSSAAIDTEGSDQSPSTCLRTLVLFYDVRAATPCGPGRNADIMRYEIAAV